ncbi:Enamine/imine deaminase [Serratia quinivorans]|uniref:RidA family protein n=1 Tax=Serratia quinivorans TaxID=137545 RepID=UPI002177F36E|nr:RidA family protein [Serratia quinivorans]CAI1875060.1 Enamine/imine deaminase [Serratia quinivorans]CAI1899506.1 Enamine/imine deaminase [Serratia quinivorans]
MNSLLKFGIGTFCWIAASVTQAESISRINPPTLLDSTAYGFTQVVVAPNNGRTVYLSGQFSSDTEGNVLGETVAEQIPIALQNLKHAIKASGAKPENVVKIQIYIVDHAQKDAYQLQSEIKQLFGDNLPASTLVPVPRLALDGMKFEIDAILVIPN